jgi:hypothetical protein
MSTHSNNDSVTKKLAKAVINSWQNFEIISNKNSVLRCYHCKNELYFGKLNEKFIHEEDCIVLVAEKELKV